MRSIKKRLIQRAAAVSGPTVGVFANQEDHQILDEPNQMTLVGADGEVFLDAVRHPPEPTDRLVAALRRLRTGSG
ncbi:MAG TPA: DUF1778 domain-containing protein [Thermoanaerobaculia bacterium]|nr:DUF1778 domain-containing protein [Thermoanaerobaculia bacterium]